MLIKQVTENSKFELSKLDFEKKSFNYTPPFAKGGGIFLTRYKFLICLTVDLFLYTGGYSLLGTRGRDIVREIQKKLAFLPSMIKNCLRGKWT